jgi:hypothetical protein
MPIAARCLEVARQVGEEKEVQSLRSKDVGVRKCPTMIFRRFDAAPAAVARPKWGSSISATVLCSTYMLRPLCGTEHQIIGAGGAKLIHPTESTLDETSLRDHVHISFFGFWLAYRSFSWQVTYSPSFGFSSSPPLWSDRVHASSCQGPRCRHP